MEPDKHRLVEEALRDHGYTADRDTTHGTLWTGPEGQHVLVGHVTHSDDPRSWLNLRAALRRQGVHLR